VCSQNHPDRVLQMWMSPKFSRATLNLANLISDTVFVWRRGYHSGFRHQASIHLEKGKTFERR